MASPFAPFANATLDFQVATGTLETDSLGNVHPGTTTQQVVALLKHNNQKRDQESPGKDINRHFYEGFVVAPLPLPNLITPDCPCSATIDGITGQFHLEFAQVNPYTAALNIHLVDRIKGWFIPDSYVSFVALSGSGVLSLIGSGTISSFVEPFSGVGVITIDGTGAIVDNTTTFQGDGVLALTGNGTIEDTTVLFSGNGVLIFATSGTIVDTTVSFSGSGIADLVGSGTIASLFNGSSAILVDGSGVISERFSGSETLTLDGVGSVVGVVNGDEILDLTGSGTIEVISLPVSGSGVLALTGSGSAELVTTFGQDSFTTGTVSDEISARSPEIGQWTRRSGTTGGSIVLTDAGRARQQKAGTGFEFQNYSIGSPPSAPYYATATVYYPASVSNYSAGVVACLDSSANSYYGVIYERVAGAFRLVKREIGNVQVTLGSLSNPLVAGESATVTIEFNDSPRRIVAKVNGEVFATSEDTTISASGTYAGIRVTADNGAASTDSFGLHLDNFESGYILPFSGSDTLAVQGTGSIAQTFSGSSVLDLAGSGQIQGITNPVSGSGVADLTGSGTIATLISGSEVLSLTGLGAIVQPFAGSAVLNLAGSGSVAQAFNGSGVMDLTGSGSIAQAFDGSGVLSLTGSGVVAQLFSGSGVLDLTGTGTVNGVVNGSETLSVTGTGTISETGGTSPSFDFSDANNSMYIPLL